MEVYGPGVQVSPWIYNCLPSYNKNWPLRGYNLWFDRWNEVLQMSIYNLNEVHLLE